MNVFDKESIFLRGRYFSIIDKESLSDKKTFFFGGGGG